MTVNHLTIFEIVFRLSLAMLISGTIGFERQYKNRPAGLRTHLYTNIYTIDLPKGMTYAEVIEDLSIYKDSTKLRLISI